MKILHVNASYKPAWIYGGPTVSVSMLCEALAAAGVEVDVFTTTANGSGELDVVTNKTMIVDGVNVTYFKRITKDHTHFSPSLLLKLWKTAKQYDAIHIHAWWNTVSMLACAIALKKKVPVVVSPRGMLSGYSFDTRNSSKKDIIHRLLGRRLLKKATFIHVTSSDEDREVRKLINKASPIISNIIRLPQSVPGGPKENGIFKIIFLSRIDPKKGIEHLLEAVADLKLNWHLTIAGTGDNSYIELLRGKADDLKISDKITWAGFAGNEKFELLSRHDLFVLPSHNENFGNAVIESLSVGTPVLVSTGVGLAKYISSEKLGWVCKATPQRLSETITDIMLNKREQLMKIRDKAPQVIQKDFNSAVLAKFYINLYTKAKFLNGKL